MQGIQVGPGRSPTLGNCSFHVARFDLIAPRRQVEENGKWTLKADPTGGDKGTSKRVLLSKKEKYSLAYKPYCAVHAHALHERGFVCPQQAAVITHRRALKTRTNQEGAERDKRRADGYAAAKAAAKL